jgi:anti-anti-sigma regulatory factor
MLRISVQPNSDSIAIILEGRVAGPWADELSRTWADVAPTIGTRKILLDLCNTTYADAAGISVLRSIYGNTAAKIITSSPWTKYLAEEITRVNAIKNEEEL